MAEEEPKEKLIKVKVRVPDRSQQGHKGYYAIQRLWPNGDSEAVIPESKLAELEAETNFLAVISKEPVVEVSSPTAATAAPGASQPEPVAPPAPVPSPPEEKPSPARPYRR